MKRFIYIALLLLTAHCSLLTSEASGQSRTNRLTRPCPGSTTPATVAISVAGNITLTPCSGGTTTITGNGNTLTSYLTSTVTYNTNAVLADTPLSVTVAASGIYAIEVVIHSTNTAKGLNLDFGGTATVTNFIGEWTAAVTDYAGAFVGLRVTAAGTDFNTNATDLDLVNGFYTFRGSIEVNAAGTFLVRGAQSASNASNTTIQRGSTLTLTKLN